MEGKDEFIDLALTLGTYLQPETYSPSGFCLSVLEMQRKERCSFVKVSMHGVMVGRKVCVIEHDSYLSLALQLEAMFGTYCVTGLQLFKAESRFSLFYQDRDGNWRTAGDVPWMEFLDCMTRLRIAPKERSSSAPKERSSSVFSVS